MKFEKLDDINKKDKPFTALLFCPPGVGKTTAVGLIAEKSKGKTLIIDVDRTIDRTLEKKEVVKDTSKIYSYKLDNINTFDDWKKLLEDLQHLDLSEFDNIAVDNISELERCILSDLGRKGKNKGVPAIGDYQIMQFSLVNGLRQMKSLNKNVIWTAWEICNQYTAPDGTGYSRLYPKISEKIVDNICGLCDVVGKIMVNKEGKRGILLEATQNIYAKNQIDNRKTCKVEEFLNFEK